MIDDVVGRRASVRHFALSGDRFRMIDKWPISLCRWTVQTFGRFECSVRDVRHAHILETLQQRDVFRSRVRAGTNHADAQQRIVLAFDRRRR